ncbi:MAG: N-formylglutamate amidohydrolase [Bacteroidota bacterium]
MEVFRIQHPTAGESPVILSVPHCGHQLPEDLASAYRSEKISFIDDTDWFVDQLYGFGPAMGITLLSANISRWVIDLNRDPDGKPLYSDGRVITGLCPVTDFLGDPIYADRRSEVSLEEVERRKDLYYRPYHNALQELIEAKRRKFGKVLLWDCHSIRQFVPSIRPEKFPDLILGDADGTAASPGLIETTFRNLESSGLQVTHNHPFKGGFITRAYGKPGEHVHALQLEMTKVNYMDDTDTFYDGGRALRMQETLKRNFDELISELTD